MTYLLRLEAKFHIIIKIMRHIINLANTSTSIQKQQQNTQLFFRSAECLFKCA